MLSAGGGRWLPVLTQQPASSTCWLLTQQPASSTLSSAEGVLSVGLGFEGYEGSVMACCHQALAVDGPHVSENLSNLACWIIPDVPKKDRCFRVDVLES